MILNYENLFHPAIRVVSFLFLFPLGFLIANFAQNRHSVLITVMPLFCAFMLGFMLCFLCTINLIQSEISISLYRKHLSEHTTLEINEALNGDKHCYKTKIELKEYLEEITPNYSKKSI